MYLQNAINLPPLISTETHQYLGRDQKQYSETEAVLTEHSLEVVVNRTYSMSFVCLPQYLTELVIGHLATEGIISSIHEIEQVIFNESGTYAEILLTHPLPDIPTPLSPVKPIPWKNDWIFSLADRFANGMPLHSQTFATHSCFLAQKENLLFECEDLGRHNALDKAVGFALLHELSLSECLLYSSGRMPSDMMCKALRAGIPILASKGAPTAKAIELARQYQLTMICAARRDRMKQYSGITPESSI